MEQILCSVLEVMAKAGCRIFMGSIIYGNYALLHSPDQSQRDNDHSVFHLKATIII